MSHDFGSHLKHEREMRGISLEEIAASTKVQLRYLQALESNQFDELPGEIFVKGFIRSYGKTIGCNAEDLISAYDEAMAAHRVDTAPIEVVVDDRHRSRSRSVRSNVLGGVTLALVLAVGVWYMNAPKPELFPDQEDSTVSDEVPDSEIAMESSPLPAPEEIEQTPALLPEEPVPGKPNQAPEKDLLENGVSISEKGAIIETTQGQLIQGVSEGLKDSSEARDRLRLVIRVSDNSWFNLKIDNSRDMDFIMPAGATKTIHAQAEIRMTVGNQRATHLTLNDKVLALPESPDNVVRNLIVNAELIE